MAPSLAARRRSSGCLTPLPPCLLWHLGLRRGTGSRSSCSAPPRCLTRPCRTRLASSARCRPAIRYPRGVFFKFSWFLTPLNTQRDARLTTTFPQRGHLLVCGGRNLRERVALLPQMGSACSTSSGVPPQAVKRRGAYSPLPANSGLESDLQGSNPALARQDASAARSLPHLTGAGSSGGSSSQASSSSTVKAQKRGDSLHRSRSVESDSLRRWGGVAMARESIPKAGLDTFVRRRKEPPQCPVGREALFGGGEVVRPGMAIAGHRGLARSGGEDERPGTWTRPGTGAAGRRALAQSATTEGANLRGESSTALPRPATSESGRANLRLTAGRDSASSRGSISPISPEPQTPNPKHQTPHPKPRTPSPEPPAPERLSSRNSSASSLSRESLRSKERLPSRNSSASSRESLRPKENLFPAPEP